MSMPTTILINDYINLVIRLNSMTRLPMIDIDALIDIVLDKIQSGIGIRQIRYDLLYTDVLFEKERPWNSELRILDFLFHDLISLLHNESVIAYIKRDRTTKGE